MSYVPLGKKKCHQTPIQFLDGIDCKRHYDFRDFKMSERLCILACIKQSDLQAFLCWHFLRRNFLRKPAGPQAPPAPAPASALPLFLLPRAPRGICQKIEQRRSQAVVFLTPEAPLQFLPLPCPSNFICVRACTCQWRALAKSGLALGLEKPGEIRGSYKMEIPHKAVSLDMPGWSTFLALLKKGVRLYV